MNVWHWVRHGPTHEKSFVGWRDVPADLSDAAQIARLSGHLPGNALVISSDLVRATATADVLAHPERIRLPHDPALRELHFGDWDGLRWDAVAARDPDLSRAYWEEPGDVQAPGGESWNETAWRVNAAVDKINERHQHTSIIAVAHFGVILTQVQRALGVDAVTVMAHKIDNLSVTTLRFDGDWHVDRINHLP